MPDLGFEAVDDTGLAVRGVHAEPLPTSDTASACLVGSIRTISSDPPY